MLYKNQLLTFVQNTAMRILILDDHIIFAKGISNLLQDKLSDLEVCMFSSIKILLDSNADFSKFDLLISDIELPNENTFEFLSNTRAQFPKLPILIVSMHNKLSVIKKCKDIGIEGYILKDDQVHVADVVKLVVDGKEFYSEKVKETLEILNKKEQVLTPKEEQIMGLIVQGKSSADIIKELFVSPNTLKTHKKNIFRKLDINSTTELVKYYYNNYI